ncbi:unnamed protein product [Darwinula stevensoni]|uniref:Uncharacterized protein n=1 Tax=Darwinula stevensoni TaxID=69355 RepID=A0A7R9ACU5_9CRUS|nr:unnamed protein product [Darwinula stevensoni]CAG0900503.1 unnamed protein product [Darwinula stevensoni]
MTAKRTQKWERGKRRDHTRQGELILQMRKKYKQRMSKWGCSMLRVDETFNILLKRNAEQTYENVLQILQKMERPDIIDIHKKYFGEPYGTEDMPKTSTASGSTNAYVPGYAAEPICSHEFKQLLCSTDPFLVAQAPCTSHVDNFVRCKTEQFPGASPKHGRSPNTVTSNSDHVEVFKGCNSFHNSLKEVTSLDVCSRKIGVDVRDSLMVFIGGDKEKKFMEAAKEYIDTYYPHAGKIHYSLPSGLLLKELEMENVDFPPHFLAKASVFDQVKNTFKYHPSLVVADYEFSKTFNVKKTFEKTLKKISEDFPDEVTKVNIPRVEDLTAHDNFLSYLSEKTIYNIFFQIRDTTSKYHGGRIKDDIQKAITKCKDDRTWFETMCGPFLVPPDNSQQATKIAAFPAFPLMERGELLRLLNCESCSGKILTRDDLCDSKSLELFLKQNGVEADSFDPSRAQSIINENFREVIYLYICAAHFVEMPRTDFQYAEACNDQMKKLDMLGMLTPKQKELIEDTSRILLIAGGSGTGKTIILKERAKWLAKKKPNAEVLVVNLPGGLLTEEFQLSFKDKDNIKVLDGKTCIIPEEWQEIVNFLEKEGKGKHVLFDEVPLTIGIRGNLDEKSLSEHWAKILNIQGCLSLTFAFRPNDVTYTKDINIHDIKVAGAAMNVLDVVKRNTQRVSDLFLALGDYSRRIFVCEEPTMRDMEFDHRGGRLLPTLLPIASCSILHASCENKLNCDAVRSSTAIFVIEASAKKPLYVCVSNRERRDRLIHTLNLAFDIEVKFIDSLGRFRGKAESSIVVVTQDQILGYHPNSEIVILDLHDCKWRNYVRMLSSCESEVTIVMDQETLRTGKYMPVRIGMPDLKTANSLDETNNKLQETFEENFKKVCEREQEITHLDENTFSRTSMLLFYHERKNEGCSNSDISQSTPKFTVIFGPPSSGKSMALFDSIQHLCQEKQENDRILLLHMGGVLSHQASLDHLQKHNNSLDIVRSEAWSPHDILDNHQVHAIRWKYPNSTIHVHVDDYRIQSGSTDEEIQMWRKFRSTLSKEQKLTLTIAFQSHSKAGRGISMKDLTILFKDEKNVFKDEERKLIFLHPRDFRGCESSVSIIVNVDDSWLLESMSRARTDLFIIDCLPSHKQVWQTMLDEERLEIYPVTGEEYIDDVTLHHLNSCGNFLV